MLKKIIAAHNKWALNKSFKAAVSKAEKIKKETNKKVWVVLYNGDFIALTKQEFKKMWHSSTALKKISIAQWEKQVHEV